MDISELHALIRDLLARVSVLEAENAVLQAENATLRAENLALKARLGQDSSNSDKPPSSDGYAKKPAAAFNRKTGKKVGGQFGHEGHNLELVAFPDVSHIHHAPCCEHCGGIFSVGDSHYSGIKERRQVWDMPTPKLEVVEHCVGVHVCCGVEHVGTFPSVVTSRIQYGVNLATLSSLLTTEYRLSYEKASQLLGDLYGCPVNVSTIATFNADLYEDLAVVEETIVGEILTSDRAHFDETGMRVEGKLHWWRVRICFAIFMSTPKGERRQFKAPHLFCLASWGGLSMIVGQAISI